MKGEKNEFLCGGFAAGDREKVASLLSSFEFERKKQQTTFLSVTISDYLSLFARISMVLIRRPEQTYIMRPLMIFGRLPRVSYYHRLLSTPFSLPRGLHTTLSLSLHELQYANYSAPSSSSIDESPGR